MSTRSKRHPYLEGNYAPIRTTVSSVPCKSEGLIPDEFIAGQYVRNGSNPLADSNTHGDIHWFDGDGMLTGVFFEKIPGFGVKPQFSNQYVLTDVYSATRKNRSLYPVIPSMATLVNPSPSRVQILIGMVRAYIIVFASLLKIIARPIKRIGAANTNIVHHDGRVLATNEIGPPMRVLLPSLKTVGWFTGSRAEGEGQGKAADEGRREPYFGGKGIEGFYKEMTTAHPRVDRRTGELILFHSTFLPPFVQYSIVPAELSLSEARLNQPVPGLSSGKLMHDFGVSSNYTVIIDCPVSLDPFRLRNNESAVEYDANGRTRLGVFPRHAPNQVHWHETSPCIVMHTANTWDEESSEGPRIHLLLCRENSLAPLYTMGSLTPPESVCAEEPESRLYYYQISREIIHQWALSVIPFEFPNVPRHREMTAAQFIYGCSMSDGNFTSASTTGIKIDCLVKIDVKALIDRGIASPPPQVTGAVDTRSIQEVLKSTDPDDAVKVFKLPSGWYAQECSFVPRRQGHSEDEG
ncbi:9-cis-epoxycarotenoid dioxygenase [Aspergillus steynii IBT 23096]|uniref:9-cis-epoxycarotenoid dioxygenase n=1 Tax=Aspergillus steynii IBT 23096 TaxID=1392250 RepID=A0A2I2GES1_9EURO|nr:9-cis-epoxycarotenoid dioxygenase [Aspergillus steynii IBT 23096]PLB51386.1 9-cis-epoxycarotenoid dioxygenase [Aspergillus steynii IBT 23096]